MHIIPPIARWEVGTGESLELVVARLAYLAKFQANGRLGDLVLDKKWMVSEE